jgi:MFS family permease
MQFSMAKRVTVTVVTGFATLVLSSTSAYTGSISGIARHFEVSTKVANLGLSLFILGFSVGPLVWAPLSERIGKTKFFFYFISLHGYVLGLLCGGENYSGTFDSSLFCWYVWLFNSDKYGWGSIWYVSRPATRIGIFLVHIHSLHGYACISTHS